MNSISPHEYVDANHIKKGVSLYVETITNRAGLLQMRFLKKLS